MIRVYCDFDGTITNRDTIVFLTEKFGGGESFRQNIFKQIVSGKMTVFEAIDAEIASVRISWEEAVAALKDEIHVDPNFPNFVEWTNRHGFYLAVVSSGMRPVIDLFLGDLGIPIFAHQVKVSEKGWQYRFDPSMKKTELLNQVPKTDFVVYVGDGTSDVEVVPMVDLLFATSYLADYCTRNKIPFVPFDSFADVRSHLEGLQAYRPTPFTCERR